MRTNEHGLPGNGSRNSGRFKSSTTPASTVVRPQLNVIGANFARSSIDMVTNEFEMKQWEKELDKFLGWRRPPAPIRDQLDIGYRIVNQSIELFEIRPVWNNPTEKIERLIAKATYVKKSNNWKVFWQRQDLKWHSYEPTPTTETLLEFLELVHEDKYACFFG